MQSQFLKALLRLLAESDDQFLDLDSLARKSGYSKYHLCRAFHAATQEPLQTYLRRLRLARAAESLLQGKRVLDVALESGYQSQEAFHRAFSKMFSITPRALQQGNYHPGLLLKQPWQETLMPPEPLQCREEVKDTFILYGTGGVYSYHQIEAIEQLWQQFHRQIPRNHASYGLTLPWQEDAAKFCYYAACSPEVVCPDNNLQSDSPPYFVRLVVPAQRYKVFRHRGPSSSMLNALNYIWGVWLPEQRELTINGIDFEYYPADYDPACENSWIDFYIPITGV